MSVAAQARRRDEWSRTASALSLFYSANRGKNGPKLTTRDFTPPDLIEADDAASRGKKIVAKIPLSAVATAFGAKVVEQRE
ncbi:MAG: hypothetical protein IKU86_10815 [Thermoguttaceae bacterium]|nr:hypothetical protein [Thermoguttaceae bacterium]